MMNVAWYEMMPGILNMSVTASIVILAVLLLRLFLSKSPKIFSYMLWGIVLFRLLCPVSFASTFSVLNVAKTAVTEAGEMAYVPRDIVHTAYPEVHFPIESVNRVINSNLPQGSEQLAADPLELPVSALTYLWLAGMIGMGIYSVVSVIRLRRKLASSMCIRGRIYLSDEIQTPFVFGVLFPKIYLPSQLAEKEREYIILHEEHHIKNVMKYKRPKLWTMVLVGVVCALAAACMAANPESGDKTFLLTNRGETTIGEAIQKALIGEHMSATGTNDGFYFANFIVLDKEYAEGYETYYGWALVELIYLTEDGLGTGGGSHIPTALTFKVDEDGYELEEYWLPGDGSYYVPTIQERFPDHIEEDAIDSQKYIWLQMQDCYAQAIKYYDLDTGSVIDGLLEKICSSPLESSNPADYISEHSLDYRELMYYGEYTLRHCMSVLAETGMKLWNGNIRKWRRN